MSDLKVSVVLPELVHEAWPKAGPILEPALERAPGRFSSGDLFVLLSRGQQILWVVLDGHQIIGAVTTRIYSTPQSRIAAVEWVGGERMIEWFDLFMDTFESFAKDNQCNKLEGHGRKGWGKLVQSKGWHWLAESYEKDI